MLSVCVRVWCTCLWDLLNVYLWKLQKKGRALVLPYLAHLAKVFSQGPDLPQLSTHKHTYYAFCLFIVVNKCCLSRTVNGTCAPICLFTVTVWTRECLTCFFTVTVWTRECLTCFFTLKIQYPSMYWNDPIGRNSNLEYSIGWIYVFRSQILLAG
jgi:hypothetical protein